ncbi:hypothetical protein EVG20_g11130 [Dentipellis fragilis]|uniref:Uncharacterized protein n=1 Tax=Dentipellis fragilis TaxID=205917 RepID=A0A4Y9XN33_9AGAM|nr:hypothetical protein EVG20_g11130 [Dentipellis fragilis]
MLSTLPEAATPSTRTMLGINSGSGIAGPGGDKEKTCMDRGVGDVEKGLGMLNIEEKPNSTVEDNLCGYVAILGPVPHSPRSSSSSTRALHFKREGSQRVSSAVHAFSRSPSLGHLEFYFRNNSTDTTGEAVLLHLC